MVAPERYRDFTIPIKAFLSSYRALEDARYGIRIMRDQLSEATLVVSNWKVSWIGVCSILRTSIDLFQRDQNVCVPAAIRKEMKAEWNFIGSDRETHSIFWKFLRQERDNIMHHYEWQAYEIWMNPDGTHAPFSLSLLVDRGEAKPVLLMRDGYYKGRDSLELLEEGANWVEDRILSSIIRAGYDPDEQRGVFDFSPRRVLPTLLGDHERTTLGDVEE